jgi:hypothetical protein
MACKMPANIFNTSWFTVFTTEELALSQSLTGFDHLHQAFHSRECSSYRIECRGIFEHKKQKMAVLPMLRVEAWVLLPNSLKHLASSIVVLEESSSEISNL